MTKEEALALTWRDTLLDSNNKRWRVNGQVKTWIKQPDKFRVPLKHGLYTYGYLTEDNAEYFRKEE